MSRMPPSPAPPASSRADAARAGLRYVADCAPGITRRRHGQHFRYLDADGDAVRDDACLQRIRTLAIPPAWTEVWICTRADGHLQATGRDARGRKQYRYHADWEQVRGAGKYDRVIAFGEALPRLRRRLKQDLALPGFPARKVTAIVVAVLADTLTRVGNDSYARQNRSYGLTTLRNRHVAFLRGGRARLQFRGKGGIEQEVILDDPRLTRLVRRCQQLPGQLLFQYRDEAGQVQPVDSGEVNDYLREAMGEAFTAKDFRTWGGTLAAFKALAGVPAPVDKVEEGNGAAGERAVATIRNAVIAEVALMLGNTPTVCRKAYIDPVVFEGWATGRLHEDARDCRGPRQWEQAALRFLRAARRGTRAAARPRTARRRTS